MSTQAQTCAELNVATESDLDRVGLIVDSKPDCACESESLSPHSPGIVQSSETIVRMVCVPMHVHLKRLELKTSFFSHIATRGASVQRLEVASDAELVKCVEDLTGADDRVWLGVVEAATSDIRELLPREGKQSYCVADAALEGNPAHAEIHSAWRIPEADQIEYRVALRDLFVRGGVQGRRTLRNGSIWEAFGGPSKERPLPAAWSGLA
ncbi:hypothetical protein [Variovorax sp. J31P179]|uniref:hypothetical protein n=1 Tax=Variovorax sp. J31P179 TaxID=3053508 RepID=UPI002575ECFF|nr:hypothetical protein [Variovorax sp. J31P179]